MKKILISVLLALSALTLPAFAANTVIGSVSETDIAAFIDKSPIESYNYKGNTYVVAEELANYGFNVVWDGEKRTLEVTRPENNFTAFIGDFANERTDNIKVGKALFPVYETDIKTYVNGNIANAYNIGGRTVLQMDELSEFGYVVWDGEERRIDVNILERETELEAPKIYGVKGEIGYYEECKGIFEGDELVYGIKKVESKDRFGTQYYTTYVNKANSSEYTYADAFKSSFWPTVTFKNKDVTAYGTEYSERNYRYGYVISRIAENGEDGLEYRYNVDGELYVKKEKTPVGDTVYDNDGHLIDDGLVRSFHGTVYRDGVAFYEGEIKVDYPRQQNLNEGLLIPKNGVMYIPSYSDPDGIIYHLDTSEKGNIFDSIYYEGNVVNGVPHGTGKAYSYGNGTITFEPEYTLIDEKGSKTFKTRERELLYEGGFFDGLYSGKGALYEEGKIKAEGDFKSGKLNGSARLYDSNILKYSGEVKNGVRCGMGIEYAARGVPSYEGIYERFVGEFDESGSWKNGKWYNTKYNAEKNIHDIYLYFEGTFDNSDFMNPVNIGTHYEYYNEETGKYEVKTGRFENWVYVGEEK